MAERFDPTDDRPFGQKLTLFLITRRPDYTGPSGRVYWAKLAADLPNVSYEVLRRAVNGERNPSDRLIETIAAHLGLPPEDFVEYRLSQDRRQLDPQNYGGGVEGVDRAARYRRSLTEAIPSPQNAVRPMNDNEP